MCRQSEATVAITRSLLPKEIHRGSSKLPGTVMNCSEHMYSVTHNNTFAFNGTLYVEIFAGSWECRSVREAAVGPRRAPGGTTCRSRQA